MVLGDVNMKSIQREIARERGNNFGWIMGGYRRLSRMTIGKQWS